MKKITQKNFFMITAQVIGWSLFFVLPFIIALNNNQGITLEWYLGYFFVPLSCMIVFYTNYLYLIERFLFQRKTGPYLAINLLMIIVLGIGMHLWHEFHRLHIALPLPEDIQAIHKARPRPPAIVFIGRDLLIMALTIGLGVAIKMTGNWYKTENEKQELEKARAEAELQNLKSQLNPHFLFNTLNNIYSLVAINPDRAQEAIHDLSRMLRHVLYDNKQALVPLERELLFMKSFIELMSLRLPKNTTLSVEIPEQGGTLMVAPLLFIALVENAFKHGVSNTQPSFIRISLKTENHHTLRFRVENSNYPKKDNDRSGSGIGLHNLKRRLQLLYPEKHSLITETKGEVFTAELILKA